MHAHDMHVCEMHVYEVHTHEVHARDMHAYETLAHEMHTREMCKPVRYTPTVVWPFWGGIAVRLLQRGAPEPRYLHSAATMTSTRFIKHNKTPLTLTTNRMQPFYLVVHVFAAFDSRWPSIAFLILALSGNSALLSLGKSATAALTRARPNQVLGFLLSAPLEPNRGGLKGPSSICRRCHGHAGILLRTTVN
jgi:hypothetical protein